MAVLVMLVAGGCLAPRYGVDSIDNTGGATASSGTSSSQAGKSATDGGSGTSGGTDSGSGTSGAPAGLTCDATHKPCGEKCVALDDPAYGCGAATCNTSACPAAGTGTLACDGETCVIGSCGTGNKKCAGKCVALADPTYGCGLDTCDDTACPDPGAGTLVCAGLSCSMGNCGDNSKKCGKKCVPLDANNGCADPNSCAACAANEVCSGTPSKCQCIADNVEACKGIACGPAINNCGTEIQCPTTCLTPNTCGTTAATQNSCVCNANDPCAGKACGQATNSCNKLIDCKNTCVGTNAPFCVGNTCHDCNVSADCPTPGGNLCAVTTCTNHSCGFTTAPANTTCPANGKCSATLPGVCVRAVVKVSTFDIDATEVTRGQYAAFLTAKGGNTGGQSAVCNGNDSFQPTESWPPPMAKYDLPVEGVDWCDGAAYCAWAGRRLCGKIGGGANPPADYANPATDQWMRACTPTAGGRWPYGDTFNAAACNGATTSTAASAAGAYTACVGGVPGLYDMSGNVAEWEDSCYANDACQVRGGWYGIDTNGAATRCDAGQTEPRSLVSTGLGIRCCSNP